MHKLMAGSAILEHELSELRLLVERQTGLMLDCPNSALAAHVTEYLESQELESAVALLDRLRASDRDPAILPHFLDGLLNANTGFFRHPTAMNALTRQVLPQLFARKSAEGPGALRIWSAGCATGEEPYSIAMAISEALLATDSDGATNGNCIPGGGRGKDSAARDSIGKDRDCGGRDKDKDSGKQKNGWSRTGGIALPSSAPVSRDWSIHIVGSDLLPSAIQTAERGLYPQSALAGLPPALIRACFSKISSPVSSQTNAAQTSTGQKGSGCNPNASDANASDGPDTSCAKSGDGMPPAVSHLLVKPRLRSLITFNTMNLIHPVYIGRFDCIFCMDVLPHLSRAQRTALLERLHLYLEPGGYLFLSQTEKLSAPNLNFRPETYDGYTYHRKPVAASAAYGR